MKHRRKLPVVIPCRLGFSVDPLTNRVPSLMIHLWHKAPEGQIRLCDGMGEPDGFIGGLPDYLLDEPHDFCRACIRLSVDSVMAWYGPNATKEGPIFSQTTAEDGDVEVAARGEDDGETVR